MEWLIGKVIKVFLCCSIAKYLTSIEMIGCGDVWAGDEPKICLRLLSCCRIYLVVLVLVAAFFPLNDTFHPFPFFFPLPCAELLLLAPWLEESDSDDVFGVLVLLLEFSQAFDLLAMRGPFFRILFSVVPLLLTFLLWCWMLSAYLPTTGFVVPSHLSSCLLFINQSPKDWLLSRRFATDDVGKCVWQCS